MISERIERLCRRFRPGTRRRKRALRFRPAVGGVERLEGRALLHGGHVARHVAALVRRNAPPPADPTAALQQALAAASTQPPGGVISVQTRDATILVPTGIVPGRTYPLVATFSWDGNPITEFQAWWNLAKENGWFVYASRDYQNSVLRSGFGPSEKVATRVKAQLDALPGTLPIDTSRIIFSGFSGGANFADFMNLRFPGYAAAVIINSGEIPALFRKTPRRGAAPMPTAASFDGSRKLGVFLCSPSDGQFYGITQANAKLMESLGWQTLFLSFPGGHSIAPPSTYNQALSWIESQPSWSAANP